jgi:hypothetical protein
MARTVGQELDYIVSMLTPRYPDVGTDDIEVLVDRAYQEVASSARLRTHLIPLTQNRCRRLLTARTDDGQSTKPAG